MLLRLSEHIQECYERALQAEAAARLEPAAQLHHVEMAKRWRYLAHSYEFVESLERFLLDLDKAAPLRELMKKEPANWRPISTAPFDRDLRLAIIDQLGVVHALVFPCRRILGGWLKAETKARIDVDPTHWQEWAETD
jgi:hypothetical protein